MQIRKTILVDVESMRYPNTGLFYYCLHLGNALQAQQNLHDARLGFYMRKEAKPLFADQAIDRIHHRWHKIHMAFADDVNVWHCTYQGSKYFPGAKQTKIVLTIHDLNVLHENYPRRKRQKFVRLLQDKIERADVVVAISTFVKDDVIRNFQLGATQLEVIHNGCNIDDTLAPAVPSIAPATPFIFTIGAITPKKNFHVLPGMLLQNDYLLVIAGMTYNQEYREKTMEVARKLNVGDRVIFTGAISEAEKHWYLENCTLFAFPSLAEGFGLPVIEAMHFGKPVLLSKATSLPEIGGEYAYYLDDFDPTYVSAKTQEVLSDYSSRNNADKIIEWSRQFDWKATAEKYWAVYERLL